MTLQWRYMSALASQNHLLLDCLFNSLFRLKSKDTSLLYITSSLWREATGNRWIPHTNGQYLMRSSFPLHDVIKVPGRSWRGRLRPVECRYGEVIHGDVESLSWQDGYLPGRLGTSASGLLRRDAGDVSPGFREMDVVVGTGAPFLWSRRHCKDIMLFLKIRIYVTMMS